MRTEVTCMGCLGCGHMPVFHDETEVLIVVGSGGVVHLGVLWRTYSERHVLRACDMNPEGNARYDERSNDWCFHCQATNRCWTLITDTGAHEARQGDDGTWIVACPKA